MILNFESSRVTLRLFVNILICSNIEADFSSFKTIVSLFKERMRIFFSEAFCSSYFFFSFCAFKTVARFEWRFPSKTNLKVKLISSPNVISWLFRCCDAIIIIYSSLKLDSSDSSRICQSLHLLTKSKQTPFHWNFFTIFTTSLDQNTQRKDVLRFMWMEWNGNECEKWIPKQR